MQELAEQLQAAHAITATVIAKDLVHGRRVATSWSRICAARGIQVDALVNNAGLRAVRTVRRRGPATSCNTMVSVNVVALTDAHALAAAGDGRASGGVGS